MHSMVEILAYTAGLFDGEGSINISTKTDKRNGRLNWGMSVSIGQTEKTSLEFVQTHFGGSIKQRSRKTVSGRTVWVWQATTKQAGVFLQLIKEYSIIKREQIDIALEFQQRVDTSVGQKRMLTEQEHLIRKQLKARLQLVRSA